MFSPLLSVFDSKQKKSALSIAILSILLFLCLSTNVYARSFGPISTRKASKIKTDTSKFTGGVLGASDVSVQLSLQTLNASGPSVFLKLDTTNDPLMGSLNLGGFTLEIPTFAGNEIEFTGANNAEFTAVSQLDISASGSVNINSTAFGINLLTAGSRKVLLDNVGTLTIDNNVTTAQQAIFRAAPSASENVIEMQTSDETPRTVIDEVGNVGIRTATPAARLEVDDDGSTNTTIVSFKQDDQGTWGLNVGNDTYSTNNTQGFRVHVRNDGAVHLRAPDDGSSPGEMEFYTDETERMVINSGGRVGIGTPNPASIFNIQEDDTTSAIQHKNIKTESTGNRVELIHNLQTDAQARIALRIRSTLNVIADATRNSLITFDVNNSGSFATALTLRGFNIGIGTTNPSPIIAGRKTLHLEDTTNDVEFRMKGSNGTDFTCDVTSDLTQIGSRSDTTLRLMTNGSGKMNILGSGLVGINAITPIAMLEIRTNATTEEGLHIKGSASQTGALLRLTDSSNNDYITSGDGLTSSVFSGNVQLADIDFIWAGDNEANLFRVDAGADVVRVGDWDTNYIQWAVDGTLTLVGTARVTKEIVLGAANIRSGAGGLAPASAIVGVTPVLQFSQSADNSAYFSIHIPCDWDSTTDMTVHVHWAPTNTNTGNVMWDIDYTSLASENDELLTAAVVQLTSDDSGQGTQDELLESPSATIVASNLAAEDTLSIRLTRDVSEDNYSAAASMVNIAIKYTVSKLGL